MPDYTVSGDVDSMLRSANDAAIRSAIGVGTTDAPTFLAQTLTGQSLTGTQATSLVDLSATWNTTGIIQTAIKLNVTDTASNAASNLMDLQVGGVSYFRVQKDGATTWRMNTGGTSSVALYAGNTPGVHVTQSTGLKSILTPLGLTFNTNNSPSNPAILTADGADVLAQRNGSAKQVHRVYNTFLGTTANEWGGFDWLTTTNTLRIGTDHAGTGVARTIHFVIGGTPTWVITTSGHLQANTDNAYDIGASGANRPRNIYVAQYVYSGQAGGFVVDGRAVITAPSDGVIKLADWPGSSFNRIQLGGTADTHPAIARDGAGIKITGAAAGSTSWIKVPAVAVSALPSAATAGVGARSFVNDALTPVFGSAVTGGGAVTVPVYSTGSAWNVG